MYLRPFFCLMVSVVYLAFGLWPAGIGHPSATSPTEAVAVADATPRLVLEAGGHQAIIRKLLFTADGRELVSVSDDKTIRVWSVSPDGRRAALARTLRGQMEEGRGGHARRRGPLAA